MTAVPLVLPRRLTIQILHAAQIAAPDSCRGWVSAAPLHYRDGEPEVGASVYARCLSKPTSAAEPQATELAGNGLHFVISLNTKGVLEMRGWVLSADGLREQPLAITD